MTPYCRHNNAVNYH
uniref:Uncharacterized protein n=1 Tax=Scylla paramamosain TaxID=85552 RepID=D2DT40_SCYPA|nr:hypothetical protein [Scylla paramamosain]